MPVVGNHEIFDGEELARFLNMTWGGRSMPVGGAGAHGVHGAGPTPRGTKGADAAATMGGAGLSGGGSGGGHTTATSGLGFLLSRANQHGPGSMGPHPSGTSRFFSANFGLLHIVALDLNLCVLVAPRCHRLLCQPGTPHTNTAPALKPRHMA